jgi:methyl-accepting chemotaxis protein
MAALDMNFALQAKEQLEQTMARIHDVNGQVASMIDQMGDIAAAVAGNVDAAVQGLQFQDVTNQLLGHVQRRTRVLDLVLRELAALVDEAAGSQAAVDELERALEQAHALGTRNPVAQAGMHAGDVDL